jgi:two-component system, response regulator
MNISERNNGTKSSFTILVADDDSDDRFFLAKAFEESQGVGEMHFVEDGEQLINYLYRHGDYADPVLFPQPKLIFLDLNMPKKNGRQALAEIKAASHLEKIPIIVWSSSSSEEDIAFCQGAGADCYRTKPERYGEMVEVVRDLVVKYSFQEGSRIRKTPESALKDRTHQKAPPGPLEIKNT